MEKMENEIAPLVGTLALFAAWANREAKGEERGMQKKPQTDDTHEKLEQKADLLLACFSLGELQLSLFSTFQQPL